MKKFLFFSIIALSLGIILSYKFFTPESVIVNKNNTSPQKLYINLFEPKLLTNTFYEYDPTLQKNTVLLKKKIPDYTTFSYSKIHNKLYFVDKAEDGTMQLFVKDLQGNQVKQLTKELGSVDVIQIDNKQTTVFMRVLLKGEYRNFHIATYNIEKDKLEIWEKDDKDKNILDFDYNPNNNKLIVVSFSEAEDKKKLEEANEKQITMRPPKYSLDIYNTDGNKERHVILMEKFISGASFSDDESSVIFSYDESLTNPTSHVAEINLNSKKIKPLFDDTKKHFKIRALKYSEKSEGFFFLSSLYDSKKDYNTLGAPKESVLSYYDIKKKTVKDIWHTDKGVIVNYSMEIK
ncbi:hypothetical protein COI51_16170 [Bacillus toyonensis]|uniref:Uncharacterized protein n=1 Tax=Bacillus toyonensis TaxID=155322 RepID=A0AB73RP10_9BACI|nr:hypothetical protein [Bacillus toyonensis]PEI84520.1 hypothetical protein CN678_19590 [Bacillus toyonensis]PEM13132.1 hypothetical protein CN616_25625 [Bacillus toyonensis]PGA43631.1 hypothetical protein COL85_21405 [Bacillus toyonensis]PGB25977.1 hypothetical protein COM06_15530 [Bacillus toyonensis]PGC32740.1 hypothetical protein COM10_24435 [Bacillus toyonensis]